MSETIIVIGAARSGTHLLASVIRENIDSHIYLGEINDLWNSFNKKSKTDFMSASTSEAVDIQKTQHLIEDKYKIGTTESIIVEKTAANVFRLPFVCKVFPYAKIIHIVRDGRDVACSVRKKMLGDVRKITKIEEKNIDGKIKKLYSLVKYKLQKGLTLRSIIKNFRKYSEGLIVVAGIRKSQDIWGPRFPGIVEYSKQLTAIELAALQWRESVSTVRNFLKANENDISSYEIRYEELLKNPDKELQKVFDYLGFKKELIKHDILPGGNTWKNILTNQEKHFVSNIIENDLLNLGYKKTEYNEN